MLKVRKSGILRTIPLLMIICLLISPAYTKYGGGTGESNDPYLIYTAGQMNAIGAEPNDWGRHFKLMADIDLKDYVGSSFNLIGSGSQPFKGVFNGSGHTISNLTYFVMVNEDEADPNYITDLGLFRYVNAPNAVIKDLGLVNPDIRPASTCHKRLFKVGGLVGSLRSGSVSNCYIDGGQVVGEKSVGGLVGSNSGIISDCNTTCIVGPTEERPLASVNTFLDRCEFFGGLAGNNSGEISDCHARGKVTGERTVGGLVGEAQGMISNSWSCSEVSGDAFVGGLVGMSRRGSKLALCYASGHVSGRRNIGGLVGTCSKESSIDNCYAIGSACAEEEAGGLVGLNEGIISECFATAFVLADFDRAGGLVGLNGGTIRMSCAYGYVSGKKNVGGLVGWNYKEDLWLNYDPFVTDSYASGGVRGEDFVGGLIGSNQGGFVSSCYSTGKVTGTLEESWLGGLVGSNSDKHAGEIENSFWDTITSGLNRSEGGTGKTTSEMQNIWMYIGAGWDFMDETTNGTEDIWWILEGRDYPRLWWQYGLAFSPEPQDKVIDVIPPVILNWLPGGSGFHHDVYFGEDEEAVANETTENPDIYRGRLPLDVTTYEPGLLELDKTYYWRIDEVNEDDPNSPWKGNVWSFRTADFLIVDDFESYNDLNVDEPGSNRIYLTWVDGYDNPEINGSEVGESNPPFIGWMIAHTGKQSMPYYYNNSGPANYSEAIANVTNLNAGQDWTKHGVKTLSLWFRRFLDSDPWFGDLENDPEPMYVSLANMNGPTIAVYYDDPNVTQVIPWTEWRIDLQMFANQGVDLTNINTISIGFGYKNNPHPGGSGKMYFDDIRLYRPTPQEPES